MVLPARRCQLVGDQPVGRVRIRDAQQRLGEAHEHHALFRRQVVLLQKRLEPALIGFLPANGAHELSRRLLDLCPHVHTSVGCLDELANELLLVGEIEIVDVRNRARFPCGLIGKAHKSNPQ